MIALYEVLPITQAVRNIIGSCEGRAVDGDTVTELAREAGFTTLAEDGFIKATGENPSTSLGEVLKVITTQLEEDVFFED